MSFFLSFKIRTRIPSLYAGLSEALVPPFFNVGLLAAAWLLVARRKS